MINLLSHGLINQCGPSVGKTYMIGLRLIVTVKTRLEIQDGDSVVQVSMSPSELFKEEDCQILIVVLL